MTSARSICVVGKVQGVWFRVSTKNEADRLALKGTVRNLPDGSVYIEIEGDEKDIQQFIAWCHQGPPLSKVEECLIKEISPRGFPNFAILR